jgi:hypothetical protein
MISRRTNGIHNRMLLSALWLRLEPQESGHYKQKVSKVYCVTVREVCKSDLNSERRLKCCQVFESFTLYDQIYTELGVGILHAVH